ncbi:hypothetical protein [Paraburkholderia hayleyella]|uniref:hypothetical protein n=1 Tax=Paraburkholderia hayleyella TaxID=2152889 RepID=UPI0012911FC3|nr:hypothetical protein [Paraburkholderia hayleyella]
MKTAWIWLGDGSILVFRLGRKLMNSDAFLAFYATPARQAFSARRARHSRYSLYFRGIFRVVAMQGGSFLKRWAFDADPIFTSANNPRSCAAIKFIRKTHKIQGFAVWHET